MNSVKFGQIRKMSESIVYFVKRVSFESQTLNTNEEFI